MVHALAILYARWHIPKCAQSGILHATEKGMSVLVQKDLSWLESELSLSSGKFLCGDHITAADVMMQYSADVILSLELGTQKREWVEIRKWLKACEETEGYKRAVEKTGYKQYTE
jgi:glutathione S-transferase